MGQIKLLNQFKSNPRDGGGQAAIKFATKLFDFTSQADMVFDASSLLEGHYPNREFATQSDILTGISSDIEPNYAPAFADGYGPYTISGPVTGSWTARTRIYAANLTGIGTKVRLTFAEPLFFGVTISDVHIGLAAPDGFPTYVDYLTPPTPVTFDGGSNSFSMALLGGDKVSDEINFAWDGTQDIVTSYYIVSGALMIGFGPARVYRRSTVNEASAQTITLGNYAGLFPRNDQIIRIEYA